MRQLVVAMRHAAAGNASLGYSTRLAVVNDLSAEMEARKATPNAGIAEPNANRYASAFLWACPASHHSSPNPQVSPQSFSLSASREPTVLLVDSHTSNPSNGDKRK